MAQFGLPSGYRLVKLKRRSNDSFGFALRGGREHQVGFFITQVNPGSESHKQGLKVGDQVIRINGLPVEEAMHNEMLNLIRTKTQLTLTVKSGTVLPYYECTNHELSWQPVSAINHASFTTPLMTKPAYNDVVRIVIGLEGKGRLGCTICQGPPHKPGIFIQSTREGSAIRNAGLKSGDQILQCNGKDFSSIEFSKAIQILKESLTLNLLVAKTSAAEFISPGESSGYNSAASSVNGDQSPTQSDKKRLSVVREEIIDVFDERRGLVVGSVTVDNHRPWSEIETEWNSAELRPISRRQIIRENSDDSQRSAISIDEEKKLQEEKRKIEEAQKLLKMEAERLAMERRLLEEEKQKLELAKRPSLTPSISDEERPIEDKQEDLYYDPAKKVIAEPKRHQQHEQLMEEFKEVHRKRFSEIATDKPTELPSVAEPSLRTGIRTPAPSCPLPDYNSSHPAETSRPVLSHSTMNNNSEAEVILRNKNPAPEQSAPAVRITIGAYPSAQQRPQPGKFDFLPPKTKSEALASGGSSNVKSLLQTELNQTLSRARLRQRLPEENGHVTAPPIPPPEAFRNGAKHEDEVDKKDSVIAELKSLNLGQNPENKMAAKIASAGRSSTVAFRKPEPVVTNSNKANTVRLSKNISTVVISADNPDKNPIPASGSRKPAPAIQARMAALVSGNPNSDDLPGIPAANDHLVQKSSDNKVIIQINAKKDGGILKNPAEAKLGGIKNISFGQT